MTKMWLTYLSQTLDLRCANSNQHKLFEVLQEKIHNYWANHGNSINLFVEFFVDVVKHALKMSTKFFVKISKT